MPIQAIIDVKQWGDSEWRNMSFMFTEAINLNQLSATDAPDLTYITSLNYCFSRTGSLGNINHWDVSSVTELAWMFTRSAFNYPLNGWDVSSVVNLEGMFYKSSFNQPLDNWDVSSVGSDGEYGHSFRQMFYDSDFNQPINNWQINTSESPDMDSMFAESRFQQDISNWDLSNFGGGSEMLYTYPDVYPSEHWEALLINLTSLPLQGTLKHLQSNACETPAAHSAANTLNTVSNGDYWQILSTGGQCAPEYQFIFKIDTGLAGDTPSNQYRLPLMLSQHYDITIDWGDGNLEQFIGTATSGIPHTYSSSAQYTISISGTFAAFKFGSEFDKNKLIEIIDFGDVIWGSVANMFDYCENLTTVSTTPNLTGVTSISNMFGFCPNFNADLSSWDVSSITNMNYTFRNCASFTGVGLSTWDVSNVTGMEYIFATVATLVPNSIELWDVSSVLTMSNAFRASTINLDISNWDVSSVLNMSSMFSDSGVFNADISQWDVSSVTAMNHMFAFSDIFNADISQWDVSSVTTMTNMFVYTYAFNQDLSNWDVSSVTTMDGMFSFAYGFDTANYDLTLNGWGTLAATTGVNNNIDLQAAPSHSSAGLPGYCELVNNHGWTITDGGGPSCP